MYLDDDDKKPLIAFEKVEVYQEAIFIFNKMVTNDIWPDKYTYTFVLKACTLLLDIEKGVWIHGQILERGCGRVECDGGGDKNVGQGQLTGKKFFSGEAFGFLEVIWDEGVKDEVGI
ncbi:pentatricopeptide repeat-containing protein [Tanacetum coccineum]